MEETKKHRTCLFSSWREPTSAPSGHLLPEEGGSVPLSPYRHFERTREIFFVRGQATAVRKAGNGKHRSPYDFIPHRESTSAPSLPHTKAFSTRKSL